jgi:L-threonylcarbamoyladenylate synthase
MKELGDCVARGGVAVFPADTVYGLACDPENPDAVRRLYELKGRPPEKPAAVMFFDTNWPEVGPRTRALMERLLPGGVTLLLPNPAGLYPLACGPDPSTLGLRFPFAAPVGRPVMQSSANLSGGPDARRLDDVPAEIREGADLVIDGGELPGTPSTVIDLREYESGRWSIVREGAVSASAIRALANGEH